MVKTLGYVLLWACGSSAAVAVAWTGVASVDDGIVPSAEVDEPVVALSSDSGADDGDRADTSVPGAGTPPSPVMVPPVASGSGSALAGSDADPDPSTATSTGRGSDTSPDAGSESGSGSAVTAPASNRAPGSTTRATTAAPTTPTTASDPATTASTATTAAPTTGPPATAAPTQAQIQTFQLVGGTTAISFSASEVKVLWATPDPGYEVDIEPESPGIKVRFRSDVHESRVDAWWSGGPRHEIREEAR